MRGELDGFPKDSIADGDFLKFQRLIHQQSGIWLSDAKKALLMGRLRKRLRELGLSSFRKYFEIAKHDVSETVRLLDAVSTNQTQFFREPDHFEYIEDQIIPEWKRQAETGLRSKHVRVWSAACSSGQEPYSLAMVLAHRLPVAEGWVIEILGTDISTKILGRASSATWDIRQAEDIPEKYLKMWMLRGYGDEAGKLRAGPQLRTLVRFERLNLHQESYPVQGNFDLIFCRNVLIYFQMETKMQVVQRLLRHLQPQGYLFLGHAESLHSMNGLLRTPAPAVYRPDARNT